MASDVEVNEPLIDVFKSTNVGAIQRVLDRAQRNADRAAKAQRSGSKPSTKPGALTKALNAAMSAYGRSAKGRPSIRLTAPDTGGRPYHFAYSHVTKGERRNGRAGADIGGAAPAGPRTKGGKNAAPSKPTTGKAGARPQANTAEAAHQVYTERDAAVDRESRALAPYIEPGTPSIIQTERRHEPDAMGIDRDADEHEASPAPGLGAEGPRRRRRPSEVAADAGMARAYAEGVVAEGQGITDRASEAAAQAYIEDPTKRPGALMGTTASFGTIDATLEERMAFWDLVHEHESAKGGRTQSRLVLELPHEATAEDRHEIVRRYTEEFRRKGIPFWASIHAPTQKNDSRNHHAHVVFTDRPMRKMPHPETGEIVWDFTVQETYIKKSRNRVTHHPYRQNRDPEMRDRGYVKLARARFSEVVNDVMKASQNAVRYDPRSYKDMGLNVAPMKNVTRNREESRLPGAPPSGLRPIRKVAASDPRRCRGSWGNVRPGRGFPSRATSSASRNAGVGFEAGQTNTRHSAGSGPAPTRDQGGAAGRHAPVQSDDVGERATNARGGCRRRRAQEAPQGHSCSTAQSTRAGFVAGIPLVQGQHPDLLKCQRGRPE